MKVSVILPVYNAAHYLESALESALGQTGPFELEILAIDDGSTDASGAILDRWAAENSNIKVVHQPNCGQGAARNCGLSLAGGDYVYFLDADDVLADSHALACVVEVMAREQLDVLLFDAETRFDVGVTEASSGVRPSYYVRKRDYSAVRTGPQMFIDLSRHGELCVSPVLMVLSSAFVKGQGIRFPEGRVFYEDNVFMTRVLARAERVAHRPWQLYARYVHAGSTVTAEPTLRHLCGYLACWREALVLLDETGLPAEFRAVLRDQIGVYRHYARRLLERRPQLREELGELDAAERAQVEDLGNYPLAEKWATLVRCCRDRGLVYTLGRVIAKLSHSGR